MGGQRASKSQGAPLGTCGAVGGGREGGRRRWRRARRRGRSSTASSGEGLVAQGGGLASRGLSEANRSFEVAGELPWPRVGDEQGVTGE